MFESDKTILAVYKSLDDKNSGARGNGVQTAGSRKYSLRQSRKQSNGREQSTNQARRLEFLAFLDLVPWFYF